MPELPEAENIARALHRGLAGRSIVGVEIFFAKLRTSLEPLLTAGLEGRKILGVRRRGRYDVVDLDDGRGLLLHFGMSGVVRIEDDTVPRRRHEHLFLRLDNGMIFRFEDPRRFGMVECATMGADGWPLQLADLGPEPLSEDFHGDYLFQQCQRRRGPVKVVVMDNAVVTGIGNIYATEALFAVGVRPNRPANEMTRRECVAFVKAVKQILAAAIEAGGSTIADFRNVDGSEGRFAQQLQIYGRDGAPCIKCGETVESVKLGGRTSAYCPKCQR